MFGTFTIAFASFMTLSLAETTKGLAQKPQMGWNTYNAYKGNINETVFRQAADEMVSRGLLDVGYEYVVIDGGWSIARNDSGFLQANTTTFSSGIPALSDYVHERGLKMGIYGDAGIYGCGFEPGSYGNEELDAYTLAAWGIDYLKYDNCGSYHGATLPPHERYSRKADALKASGREIFFSACQWGNQFPWLWADQITHSYRIAGDIYTSFNKDKSNICKTAYCLNTGYAGVSIVTMIRKMREISYFQQPGSWADMDLLEIGNGDLTEDEERTHFSFWAALKSPLMVSTNLSKIRPSSLNVLLNKEIIAISQDDLGVAVDYAPKLSVEGSIQIWAGPLDNGRSKFVILAFNEGATVQDITIPLQQVPRYPRGQSALRVRDVWEKKSLGQAGNEIHLKGVRPHETKVLVFSE